MRDSLFVLQTTFIIIFVPDNLINMTDDLFLLIFFAVNFYIFNSPTFLPYP